MSSFCFYTFVLPEIKCMYKYSVCVHELIYSTAGYTERCDFSGTILNDN